MVCRPRVNKLFQYLCFLCYANVETDIKRKIATFLNINYRDIDTSIYNYMILITD